MNAILYVYGRQHMLVILAGEVGEGLGGLLEGLAAVQLGTAEVTTVVAPLWLLQGIAYLRTVAAVLTARVLSVVSRGIGAETAQAHRSLIEFKL